MTGVPAVDWWYVRAYPGPPGAMDAAVRAAVPWLRARARELSADRWFFIRYVDAAGYHLRLRLRAAPDALDELHGRLDELWALLADLPVAVDEPLVAGLGPMTGTDSRGVAASWYAPELRKYGGPAGVALAERVFTDSSDLVCDLDIAGLARGAQRSALAVAYARALVCAALPAAARERFWAGHRTWWSGHLREVGVAAINAALPTLRDRISRAGAVVRDTGVAARLAAHVELTCEVIDRAAAGGVPVARDRLLFHHLHMTMNRFGFSPGEEALLGLLARHAAPAPTVPTRAGAEPTRAGAEPTPAGAEPTPAAAVPTPAGASR
jgi:hypothetical protein